MQILQVIVLISLFIGLGLTVFSLFGTFIIFISALIYSIINGFQSLTVTKLIILGMLYVVGEFLEFILAYLGTRKLGASRKSGLMAILGGIIGFIIGSLIPGIGIFIGSLLGLFTGAFIMEVLIKRDVIASLKAGIGSIMGRFSSVIAKFIIALIMCAIIVTSIY